MVIHVCILLFSTSKNEKGEHWGCQVPFRIWSLCFSWHYELHNCCCDPVDPHNLCLIVDFDAFQHFFPCHKNFIWIRCMIDCFASPGTIIILEQVVAFNFCFSLGFNQFLKFEVSWILIPANNAWKCIKNLKKLLGKGSGCEKYCFSNCDAGLGVSSPVVILDCQFLQ